MTRTRQHQRCISAIHWLEASGALTLGAMCALAVIGTPPAQAQTDNTASYKPLYSFTGGADGGSPAAGVILDPAGNLYGTTAFGGASDQGVVFKLDTTGTETVLYSFTGGTDGGKPQAGLIRDSAGNIYGTTTFGGIASGYSGYGVVFKLDTTGTETVLHSFTGGADGSGPGGVIRDSAGNLYGTTGGGGIANCLFGGCGVVYKLDTTGTETVLYSFTGGSDGSGPGDVILDSAGNLYGITDGGGASNLGVVFKLDTTGAETVLHSFTGGADGSGADGGVLILDSAGNLYGTTALGGASNLGVVFKLDTTGTETVLYSFTGGADGSGPAGVILDSAGNLYGITQGGGSANCPLAEAILMPNCGLVYKLDTTGTQRVLPTFTGGADGGWPNGVIRDAAGNLYGTTDGGGASNRGVVFTIAAPAPAIAVTPSSLQLSYAIGGTVPAAQSIQVTNSGSVTLTWSASATAAWLVLSVPTPSTLAVSLSPAGLSAGTYTSSVQISAAGASNTPLSIAVTLTVAAVSPSLVVALSTAGQVEPFAAQSIVSAYGTNLATGTASAVTLPVPTLLDGTSVTVTDSAGVARLAPLFYVSPMQVNFVIPAGMATGTASVSIQNQNGTTQSAAIQIGNVSPGLFQLNTSGLIAAWVLPVISGTQQPLQPVYQIASGSVIPLPINLGPSTQEVYLEMYGTGIRNANSVTVTVGGLNVPVLFAGAAPGFAGEDQVNIGPLPQSLAGKGSVRIIVTADEQAANTVNVTIQ